MGATQTGDQKKKRKKGEMEHFAILRPGGELSTQFWPALGLFALALEGWIGVSSRLFCSPVFVFCALREGGGRV